ncbi:MAG TPA: lytic murein transglycosylase [Vicinamibacterales bacterium]|nr:lytic murein transglycosylase [Vicinamibacterales bacterium]
MRLAALLLAATILAPQQTVAPPPSPPFEQWLQELIAEARARGFGDDLIDATLSGITPVQRVVERDNSQAEFTITLDRYFETRVTPRIIRLGRAQLMEQRAVLRNIRTAYGVSPGVVLAIWGMESHYGEFTGTYPVFQALATLAYAPRRSDFFRSELFKALAIVSGGYIDAKTMTGSWAGAMGQPQFMPSSYLEHAVDFDKDGLRDIWHSKADTLASIANYLKDAGWEPGETWGREVKVSREARAQVADIPKRDAGCSAKRLMTERRPLPIWRDAGVKLKSGAPLPVSDIPASLIDVGGRSFLVYPNYERILDYNCAHLYALSVAMLADRLQ